MRRGPTVSWEGFSQAMATAVSEGHIEQSVPTCFLQVACFGQNANEAGSHAAHANSGKFEGAWAQYHGNPWSSDCLKILQCQAFLKALIASGVKVTFEPCGP